MKVLHINQSDITGGAAIASYRLHQGLLLQGIDSRLLVDIVKINSDRVALIERRRYLESISSRLAWRLGLNYINILSTFNIAKNQFYQDADLINFHNLHGDYFNYLAIPSLTKYKPAIFTLHDMWSFTGHCTYSYDCEKWQTGCGNCPYLDTYPAIPIDNTRLEWKLKDWIYRHSNLTIVTPSKWLAEQAKKSMLNRFSIYHIPNGIDTDVYHPLNRAECRSVLRIPQDKKVLMFVSFGLSDSRKGGDLLIGALHSLPESLKKDTILLILGQQGEKLTETVSIPTINLGYISGDLLKSIAYSAADLFVFPTRADNLPLVLQESMACGIPMVSFDIGGVSDLVRPGITGELANPENVRDFAQKIIELLEDNGEREKLSQNCREIAVKEYSIEIQAKGYIELYSQILKQA